MSWYDPSTWNNPVDWAEKQWDDLTGATAAKEQAGAVSQAAAEDRAYLFPNASGPLGSQNVTRDPVTGAITVNTSLSPEQDALVKGLRGDLGTGRRSVEDAMYARSASRLDPQWAQTEDKTRAQLYNQGLREGDAAFDTQMGNLGRQKTDAYDQARNAATISGGQEQSRLMQALLAQSNPGLQQYWGTPNSANAAIAQGNIMNSVPSGLEQALAIAKLAK